MAYLYGERIQTDLLPQSIEDYVLPDDPVRVYDFFVEQLDFEDLGVHEDRHQVGPPEYDPKAMLKLLVYGYSYGVRSSRKLERAVYHNLSFIWLMGGLKPDHKTIARFRRDNLAALRRVLKQCVRLCLKLDLIDGNILFVDGTKVSANASFDRSFTKVRCERLLEKADRRIEEILAECEVVDQAEKDQASLVQMKDELKAARSLRDKVQDVLKELERSGRKTINTTDPDCRHVKSRQQVIPGYNLQSVVDDKNGLIVQADVVNDSNDVRQLGNQIEQANKTLDRKCKIACADSGYANTQQLKAVEEQGIKVIVPSQAQARKKPLGPFGKDKFVYDLDRDCYICPEGQLLRYRKTDFKTRQKTYQVSRPAICHRCRNFGVCTKAKQGRSIVVLLDKELKERLEAQYASPESQVIYQRRKQLVEHPFGHLKHNLGVRTFRLRGLQGVRAEANLLATCFNLTRLITLMGVSRLVYEWSSTR